MSIRSVVPSLPWQADRKPGCNVCGETGRLKYVILGFRQWLCEECIAIAEGVSRAVGRWGK